jgi:hypothetical protein
MCRLTLGLVIAALLVTGGSSQQASSQVTNTAFGVQPGMDAQAAQASSAMAPALEEQTDESGLADAAVQPIAAPTPAPSNIKLTEPAAELIKLAESGVEEGVLLAFVTNSTSLFNLGAEEIIYLNDLGVPGSVLAAVIQHDQTLRELSGSPAPERAAPVAEAVAEPEVAPEPPPAAYGAGDYSAFYGSLAPYGTWIDVAGYGPCWRPTVVVVNPTWQPYCDGGRWIYTDCGWYWLSGYSWGWAPFHYGRWFRHRQWGWCWEPDRVWGPSWVCWRYSGNYCGWAPLPPGVGFSAGIGLTYRGQGVRAGFSFGLGASAFTFVNVSHFRDHHLRRHLLPRPEAVRAFGQTTASARFAQSNNRIINHGIPVSQVAAATRTDIHRVAIHHVNSPGGRGGRGERFEGNSGALSVFRPHFPAPSGAPPASGSRPRSEIHNGRPGQALPPTTQRATPEHSSRTEIGRAATPPSARQPSFSRPERPATWTPATPTIRPSSEPTPASPRREVTPKPGNPLILHGSDRFGRSTSGNSSGRLSETPARQVPSFSGRRESNQRQTPSQPSAPTVETPRSRPAFSVPATTSRREVGQRSQPSTPPTWRSPARLESPRSNWQPSQPSARTEHQRQYVAPSTPTPAPTPRPTPTPSFSPPRSTPAPTFSPPRSTPAPSFSPPSTHSSSPPSVSPTPRSQPSESRSSHSESRGGGGSASGGSTHSSSDRRGR